MKRMLILAVLLLSALSLFAIGTVVDATGRVEVEINGVWRPLLVGDTVALDAVIATGFSSTARVRIGSSLIDVAPLSQVELSSLSLGAGREEIALGLPFGEIRAEVRKTPQAGTLPFVDFRVLSPVSTAAVRGTTFVYDGVTLSVTEGEVDLSNAFGQWHSVREGQTSEAYRWGISSVETMQRSLATEVGVATTE